MSTVVEITNFVSVGENGRCLRQLLILLVLPPGGDSGFEATLNRLAEIIVHLGHSRYLGFGPTAEQPSCLTEIGHLSFPNRLFSARGPMGGPFFSSDQKRWQVYKTILGTASNEQDL
ncbi:hypothetical protein TNCV_3867941 [Trichonephila clavipes]|nr:hypothetical protein TNCV_3867941 [Trichonephila clavipes]